MAGDAALVIVGNEILSGKTEDQNAPFLTRELRELGTPLRRVLVVEDSVPEIAWAVESCLGVADAVITTGGIGPTHDDVTVAGVAAALRRPVLQHPDLARRIRLHMERDRPGASSEEIANALKMADVPEGAELHLAEGMTWPVLSAGGVFIFPGIPSVLRRKWAAVRERFRQQPFHLAEVFLLAEEHAVATELARVQEDHPGLLVGSYPDVAQSDYRVKVTLESKDQAQLRSALDRLLALLRGSDVLRVTGPGASAP